MKKQCTRCKQWLPLTEFHKHKPSKDGRKSRCKNCRCELQTEYVRANPEIKKESDRKYYHNNREAILEYNRTYNFEHREEKQVRDAEYRTKNSERLKMWFRNHYQKNREVKLEQVKQYAVRNQAKVSQYQKTYRKKNAESLRIYYKKVSRDNRERYRLYSLNYLARKKGATGKHTLDQWLNLCSFFDEICPCCKQKVKSFEADHIVPLTWDNTSNMITNIQPLCKSCNSSKSNHHDTDYRPRNIKLWAEKQECLK